MHPQTPKRRSWRRRIGRMLLLVGLTIGLAVAAFLFVAHGAQRNFRPIQESLSSAMQMRITNTPKYQRSEDATYLTFPEWYLVFNPQEYGRFITASNRPSQFPYGLACRQIWRGYAEVYGITSQHYAFNPGYNLMLVVIGTSSTFEFAVKGLYENTVGRLSEWTAGGKRTSEDDYAAEVARAYGDFIPTQPWFEFPFGGKLKALWTDQSFFGPNFIRKCERKAFLSLEYGVKTLYAAVIRAASRSVYGVADTEVYLSAHAIGEKSLARPGVRGVERVGEGRWIITVPHYQGFTDTVPLLARDGVEFEEIAGNDEIMLTMVVPVGSSYRLPAGNVLFSMNLLTGNDQQRVAVQVPVKSLGAVLRAIDTQGLRLEHLFDY